MSRQMHIGGYARSVAAPTRLIALIALAVGAQLLPHAASAQNGERSGKEVVEAVCAACHATGANGAPKIGDKNAWSKRAARGLSSLTQTALKGIRKMPAHGGNAAVTDLETGQMLQDEFPLHFWIPRTKCAAPMVFK